MTKFDISVVITTKNEQRNVRNCLESVCCNTNVNKEIILVDNFSTDNTIKIAKEFNCKILRKGPERSSQRNHGILDASAAIILFLDCDMIIGPKLIFKYLDFLNNNSNIVGCYIPEMIIGNNFYSKIKNFERQFYSGTVLDCSRVFYKKNFLETGMFDEKLCGVEDWDFDKRLRQTGKIKLIKFEDYDEYLWSSKLLNLIKKNSSFKKINNSIIYHNESDITFYSALKKKIYYFRDVKAYIEKWPKDDNDVKKQFGFFYRFFFIFFEKKKYLIVLKSIHFFIILIIFKSILGFLFFFKKK